MADIRNRGLDRTHTPGSVPPDAARSPRSTYPAEAANPIQPAPSEVFHNRPATREEVAYRDGYVQGQRREGDYVQGRLHERDRIERNLPARDNNNAARGLLIGIAITSLVAAVIGAVFFLDYLNREPEVVPVPVLNNATEDGDEAEPPQVRENNVQVQERVIERVETEVVPVPLPQQSVPVSQPAPAAQPPVQSTQPAQPPVQSQPAPAQPSTTTPAEAQSQETTTDSDSQAEPLPAESSVPETVQ